MCGHFTWKLFDFIHPFPHVRFASSCDLPIIAYQSHSLLTTATKTIVLIGVI